MEHGYFDRHKRRRIICVVGLTVSNMINKRGKRPKKCWTIRIVGITVVGLMYTVIQCKNAQMQLIKDLSNCASIEHSRLSSDMQLIRRFFITYLISTIVFF